MAAIAAYLWWRSSNNTIQVLFLVVVSFIWDVCYLWDDGRGNFHYLTDGTFQIHLSEWDAFRARRITRRCWRRKKRKGIVRSLLIWTWLCMTVGSLCSERNEDFRPQKQAPNTDRKETQITTPESTQKKSTVYEFSNESISCSYSSVNGIDGIKYLSSTTLDGDQSLREAIKQPNGVSLDQSLSCVHFTRRWIYDNLMESLKTTEMLYDWYRLGGLFIP